MLRNLERVCASIEQCACCLGVVIMKRLKPCRISARHLGRVFDFNRMEAVWTVNHKIDFDSRFRPPEEELVLAAAVVVPGREMLEDKAFETGTFNFARSVQRAQTERNFLLQRKLFVEWVSWRTL